MKITVNQQKFLEGLRAVERVVAKNVSLPILHAVLMKTEGSNIRLTATNLEIGIHYNVGAKVEEEGTVAIPARIISDFIGSIQDEKITLTSERNTLLISSEHYKTNILGMKADEFPIIPTLKNAVEFSLSAEEFRAGLASVFDSASLLETRPELSGVFVQVMPTNIIFAATDSFRLSERVITAKTNIEKSFILPRTTAMEIMRLISDLRMPVSLRVSDNQVSVRGDNFELVSRLIDGRYPEYKRVIPERFTTTVSVSKQELERNVRMASIFSSQICDLTLRASDKAVHLMAKNTDRGEIASHVASSGTKAPFAVAVNYRYLLDGLKIIPENTITIGYTGEGSPLVLKGEGSKDHVYVIMPLRT